MIPKVTLSVDHCDVLHFQVTRIITQLFKNHLMLLEDVASQHDESLQKLENALPAEYRAYVALADYLTPERGTVLRKKTLDAGNDACREVGRLFEQFKKDLNH